MARRAAGYATEPADAHAGGGHRHARLEQVIHEELAALARDELADPRLDGVAFTAVELSVDYRNARVRFVPGDANPDPQRTARALERAIPFLRARLAESLGLKFVPALRFVPEAAPPFE